MRFRKMWLFGVALCGAIVYGSNSEAGSINFLATGTFTRPVRRRTPTAPRV